MKNFKLFYVLLLSLLISCGEEVLTQNTQTANFSSPDLASFELNTCSQMTFEKPAVDILYIIDNSGSTLASSFQEIKTQIQNTVSTISNEFDYHIYFAPLNSGATDTISGYPLILSNPDTVNGISNLNVFNPDQFAEFNMFGQASGNNSELGFQRAQNIINQNRVAGNNIFRDGANTIVVMISNGDDTESNINIGGNIVFDSNAFNAIKDNLKTFTSAPMSAESFRFISLVAHSTCNGWMRGTNYKRMSNELYSELGYTDNPSSKDSYDLCSGNYTHLFTAINNSIRQILVGHKYDHWKISSASSSSIQEDDIILTLVKSNGTSTPIAADELNGFEYLGYKVNQPTRYAPTTGEAVTGLVVKLNGSARVEYPDCVIAKTRTPTEYFGYIAIPKDPDLATIEIKIDGVKIEQSTTDGWSYLGWREVLNIKVPGPTDASILPALNKTGYMIQLNGSAIFTNGQTVNVYYKPKPI
jgi:hypothetical protein